MVAAILAHLPAPGRTRRQVVKQLVRLGLATSARDFPRERWVGDTPLPRTGAAASPPPGQGPTAVSPHPRKGTGLVLWTPEQEEELTRLFEEFQGSDGERGRGGLERGSPP